MPTITVPEDIEVKVPGPRPGEDVSATVSFVRDFLLQLVLADDAHWGTGRAAIYDANDVRLAFKDASPGSVCRVSTSQLAKLQASIDNPSKPFRALVAAQLVPFFKAIEKPTEE